MVSMMVAGLAMQVSFADDGAKTSEQAQPEKGIATPSKTEDEGRMIVERLGYSIVTNGFSVGFEGGNLMMTLRVPQAGEIPPMIMVIALPTSFPEDISMEDCVPTIKTSVLQNMGKGHRFLNEEVGANSAELEFTALFGNEKVHFHSKVIRKEQKMFVAMAFTPEIQWKTVSKRLIAAVNSFSIITKE